jgi:hypothetical protein
MGAQYGQLNPMGSVRDLEEVRLARVGDAGAANNASYAAQKDDVLDRHSSLDAFASMLDGARPGTNVDAHKVLHYDRQQAVLDARSLAIATANGDVDAGLAEFNARSYSARREAFEDLWDAGRRFVYGAPNPGTLGARKYGDYCLIIDPATLTDADTGVFPRDTAQTYTDSDANVFADLAYREVGSWQARADVALVHRGDEAVFLSDRERAELVCGADTYMEVITVGPLGLDQVIILRVDADNWEEHSDLWWDWKEGRLSDPSDRAKAKAYDALMGWADLEIETKDGDE